MQIAERLAQCMVQNVGRSVGAEYRAQYRVQMSGEVQKSWMSGPCRAECRATGEWQNVGKSKVQKAEVQSPSRDKY